MNGDMQLNRNGKLRRAGRPALLSLMLFAAVMAVAAVLLLSGGKGIAFPYGIRPDMSLNEIRVKMEDAGIGYSRSQEYGSRTSLFFDESFVNGHRSDFAVLDYQRKNGSLSLSFYFVEEKTFGRQNPSAAYGEMKNWLRGLYGKPDWDMDGLCRWDRGKYSLCLSYTDFTGGNLSLAYSFEP